METMGQYVLDGQTPVPCDDMMEWARWMQTGDRRVAETMVGEVRVSTVFLGLDHGFAGRRLLFETMIFSGEHNQDCWRYATWAEAEAGHRSVVESLGRGEEPEP